MCASISLRCLGWDTKRNREGYPTRFSLELITGISIGLTNYLPSGSRLLLEKLGRISLSILPWILYLLVAMWNLMDNNIKAVNRAQVRLISSFLALKNIFPPCIHTCHPVTKTQNTRFICTANSICKSVIVMRQWSTIYFVPMGLFYRVFRALEMANNSWWASSNTMTYKAVPQD